MSLGCRSCASEGTPRPGSPRVPRPIRSKADTGRRGSGGNPSSPSNGWQKQERIKESRVRRVICFQAPFCPNTIYRANIEDSGCFIQFPGDSSPRKLPVPSTVSSFHGLWSVIISLFFFFFHETSKPSLIEGTFCVSPNKWCQGIVALAGKARDILPRFHLDEECKPPRRTCINDHPRWIFMNSNRPCCLRASSHKPDTTWSWKILEFVRLQKLKTRKLLRCTSTSGSNQIVERQYLFPSKPDHYIFHVYVPPYLPISLGSRHTGNGATRVCSRTQPTT